MKIIGISGKAESGKDTAAGFIQAVFERPRRTSFADALKLQAVRNWLSEPDNTHPFRHLVLGGVLDDDQVLAIANALKANAAFRSYLQSFGESKRAEDSEYWIRRAFERHALLHGNRPMLIADMRYKNEAEEVRRRRGFNLRIERPDHENKLTPAQRAHPSECDLDDYEGFHAIVTNTGDPVQFLVQVLGAVKAYMVLRPGVE